MHAYNACFECIALNDMDQMQFFKFNASKPVHHKQSIEGNALIAICQMCHMLDLAALLLLHLGQGHALCVGRVHV